MVCESKTCRYPANGVGISCTEFKSISQHSFSVIDDFHNVHCLTVRGTAIAGKHGDEMRGNCPHVCKSNGMITPVDFCKETLPAAVYSHGINDDQGGFMTRKVFIDPPKMSEFEV